jgi:hypothetical protein
MRIYIDESNIFKAEHKAHSISCVAALIIPDSIESALFDAFNQWKLLPSLQLKKDTVGEIKGSKLDENDISSLLLLLSKFDILIEAVCIDMGVTTDIEVNQYKKEMADSFSKSQTGEKLNIQFSKDIFMSLSNPLFLEGLLLCKLINKVLKTTVPYYAQRFPQQLGSFDWFIDAKDKYIITEYEKILTHIVKPLLQSISFNDSDPASVLDDADYSAFSRYFVSREHLLEPLKNKVSDTSALIFSISDIMKNISFEQSHKKIGIQIVDIIANCIKRAMEGNLQFDGWKYLSSFLILRKHPSISVTRVDPTSGHNHPAYTKFINYFQTCGKQMIVPKNIKSKISKGYIRWNYLDKAKNNKWKMTTLEHY